MIPIYGHEVDVDSMHQSMLGSEFNMGIKRD